MYTIGHGMDVNVESQYGMDVNVESEYGMSDIRNTFGMYVNVESFQYSEGRVFSIHSKYGM